MPQPSAHPPAERRPGDDSMRTKREDCVNDRRTRANHPDDDRPTPADLLRRERERRSRHAQTTLRC